MNIHIRFGRSILAVTSPGHWVVQAGMCFGKLRCPGVGNLVGKATFIGLCVLVCNQDVKLLNSCLSSFLNQIPSLFF